MLHCLKGHQYEPIKNRNCNIRTDIVLFLSLELWFTCLALSKPAVQCSLMLCDRLIHRTRHDLAQVVALLKTQIDPELLAKEKEASAAEGGEKNDGGKFWNSHKV